MEQVRSTYGRSGKDGVGVGGTAWTCEVDPLTESRLLPVFNRIL